MNVKIEDDNFCHENFPIYGSVPVYLHRVIPIITIGDKQCTHTL